MLTAADAMTLMTKPPRAPLSDAESALLGEARRQDIDHHGQRLASWTWGQGTPLLLVHGWASQASHLGAFVHPLVAAGFSVTAFDGPAHGQSEGDFSSVIHHSEAVLAVARAHGPFAGVLAHSVGSPATLRAFAHGLRVEASVHIAGPVSLEAAMRGFAAAVGLPKDQFPTFRTLVSEYVGQPIESMELQALAHGLRHPALVIHAPEDPEVPYAAAEHLHTTWSGSELLTVPGLGHRRIIRDAAVVSAVVDFFQRRGQLLRRAA